MHSHAGNNISMKKTGLLLFICLMAVSCRKKDAQYFFERGNDAFNSSEYNSAIDNMTMALRLKPDYCLAYFTRACSFFSTQHYDNALNDYTNAIYCDPRYAVAYRFRGVVKVELGDTLSAYKDWQTALEFGDNRAEHYLRIYRKYVPDETRDEAK
jgi:Tfp pilus assembly protein PilF